MAEFRRSTCTDVTGVDEVVGAVVVIVVGGGVCDVTGVALDALYGLLQGRGGPVHAVVGLRTHPHQDGQGIGLQCITIVQFLCRDKPTLYNNVQSTPHVDIRTLSDIFYTIFCFKFPFLYRNTDQWEIDYSNSSLSSFFNITANTNGIECNFNTGGSTIENSELIKW